LQSISASIEGSLAENTANWQARFVLRLVMQAAHRGDGKRYVVRADEMLTAFVELESAIRQGSGH
jgi:hypothetical protein